MRVWSGARAVQVSPFRPAGRRDVLHGIRSIKACLRTQETVPKFGDIGSYKFFFYSAEGTGQHHVHVRRDRSTAKFCLDPVRIERSRRFGDHELRVIHQLVEENKEAIMEVWDEHFSG